MQKKPISKLVKWIGTIQKLKFYWSGQVKKNPKVFTNLNTFSPSPVTIGNSVNSAFDFDTKLPYTLINGSLPLSQGVHEI